MALVAQFRNLKSALPDHSCLLKVLQPTVGRLLNLLTVTCTQAGPPGWCQQWLLGDLWPKCRASILSLRSVKSKLDQQKAVASVTVGVYQIRTNQVLSNASVSCVSGQEGSQGSCSSVSCKINCYTKIKEAKSCHLRHCLSVECVDPLNFTVKAAWMKNVDICCWKLFTFYCYFVLSWHWLPPFWALLLSKKRTWKGVYQRQDEYTGEKAVQVLFLGLLNYSLRSKACCIYNGYMSCLFYYFFLNLKTKILCFLFDYIALHSVLVKPCHMSVFTLM